MKIQRIYLMPLFFLPFTVLAQSSIINAKAGSRLYTDALKMVTDVMVEDVASPVAAARYYGYVTLAAYETALHFKKGKGLAELPLVQWNPPFTRLKLDNKLANDAVVYALLSAGKRLLPSGYKLTAAIDAQKKQIAMRKAGINIVARIDTVVAEVLKYAAADGFKQLNTLQRYTPLEGAGFWQPTAPGFLAAVEPHWKTIRPFVLNNIKEFKPFPPIAYDTLKNAPFYALVQQVYDTCVRLTKEQQNIAMFWDCNPFAVQQIGHMEFGLKKISPGGHWMSITGIASNKAGLDIFSTAKAHVLVAITLHDAFIACWAEKYRSNRVRPETVIQLFIDRQWKPLLQTPPFPEYTSGHSVISSAASEVLTWLFGQDFSFTDNTEVEFGLPTRQFSSLRQAAKEAGISRLYGGIHYMDAIENGMNQGTSIGKAVVIQLQNVMSPFVKGH